MFYNLRAFGKDLHLKVKKNSQLFAPNYKHEVRNKDSSTVYLDKKSDSFFHGKVTSEPDSLVSISNRGGLVSAGQATKPRLIVDVYTGYP